MTLDPRALARDASDRSSARVVPQGAACRLHLIVVLSLNFYILTLG